MVKKILLSGLITLVVIFFIFKFATFYRCNGAGDICGADQLKYILAPNSTACWIVNGEYNEQVAGWSNTKKMKSCNVKSAWLCALRGGRFAASEFNPSGSKYNCVKK
jgi:hypothetical protein